MLSVAKVRSAGGAASYFANVNYYAAADADRSGIWVGKGAERLGLSGTVGARAFEAILRGELPGGGRIGRDGAAHRAAVIETLQRAEKNAAFVRVEKAGTER